MNASNCDLEYDFIPLEVNAEVLHGEAQTSLLPFQATYRQTAHLHRQVLVPG